MRKVLATVLATVLFASMSFAASARETINKESIAEIARVKELKTDAEKRSELLKMVESFNEKGKKASDAEKVLKGLENLLGKDKALEMVITLTKAKDSSDAQVKQIMDHVRYAVKTMVENGSGSEKEVIAPLLGAAKLAVTEMDEAAAKKLLAQISDVNGALHMAKKSGSKLTADEASLLAFANKVMEGKDSKGQSIAKVEDVPESIKKEYEEWKKNCQNL